MLKKSVRYKTCDRRKALLLYKDQPASQPQAVSNLPLTLLFVKVELAASNGKLLKQAATAQSEGEWTAKTDCYRRLRWTAVKIGP